MPDPPDIGRPPAEPLLSRSFAAVELRAVFGTFTTGVTVLTVGGPAPHGMTANSFTSVSLDPPLALICVSRDARMYGALQIAEAFAVSILAADQEPVARWFSDPARPLGASQFATIDHTPGPVTGAPLIAGSLAWLECRLWRIDDAGDHSIFLGRPVSIQRHDDRSPLLLQAGTYLEGRRLTGEAPIHT